MIKKDEIKAFKKKRKQEKNKVEMVEFDFTKRKDFITGFRKRRVEKIEKKRSVALEAQQAEKREFRREKRGKLAMLKDYMEAIDAISNHTTAGQRDANGGSVSSSSKSDKNTTVHKQSKTITTVSVKEINLDNDDFLEEDDDGDVVDADE